MPGPRSTGTEGSRKPTVPTPIRASPARTLALARTAFPVGVVVLGLGLRQPVVSWGVLLQQATNVRTVATYPWLMWPAVFVILTVLGFNFMGDGLRDAADPYATMR